jgi:hypothetical protein
MTELIAYLPTPFPADLPYAATFNGNNDNEFGVQFDLTAPICVTAVGAFDDLQDGFDGDINVSLWLAGEDNTGTLIDGSHTTFTSSDAGDLDGIFRWKSLQVPFELTVGTYFIVDAGFGDNDKADNFMSPGSVQPGDEALVFTGWYRWVNPDPAESQPNFPTSGLFGNGVKYFMRGNFKFSIGDYDCTAQPVNKKKKNKNKNNNKNRQNGKKGKRDGKKGKKD